MRVLGVSPANRAATSAKRVQVGAGQPAGVAGPAAAGDLDVEADRALDVGDQVGQRLVDAPAQRRAARRASAASRRSPSAEYACRRAQVVQRLDQAAALVEPVVGRPPASGRRRGARAAAASSRARRCSATRSRGPIRQRAPVSSRSSAAPAVGSASTCSVQTTSRTSGVSSSPPRPTTSTGRPRARSAASSGGICARARTSTAVDGAVALRRASAVRAAPPADDLRRRSSAASSTYGRQQRSTGPRPRPAVASAGRSGSTGDASRRAAAPDSALATSRIPVAVAEAAWSAAAPARRSRRPRSGTSLREPVAACRRWRRASRRSTGTGRRPRSPGARRRTARAAAPPGRGWCPGTRRAAPPRNRSRSAAPTSGWSRATRGRAAHLVAEVHRLQAAACAPVAPDQRQQREPGRAGRSSTASAYGSATPGRGARAGASRSSPQAGVQRRSSSGVDQVLGQLAGQRRAPRRSTVVLGAGPLGIVARRTCRTTASASCQHAASVSSRTVGSNAGAQRVLGDHPRGVRVVGRDGRLAGQQPGRRPDRRRRAGPQLGQPGPDPVRQLAGRLAGEGQAEHLVGARPARWRPARPPGRPSSRSCRSRRRRPPAAARAAPRSRPPAPGSAAAGAARRRAPPASRTRRRRARHAGHLPALAVDRAASPDRADRGRRCSAVAAKTRRAMPRGRGADQLARPTAGRRPRPAAAAPAPRPGPAPARPGPAPRRPAPRRARTRRAPPRPGTPRAAGAGPGRASGTLGSRPVLRSTTTSRPCVVALQPVDPAGQHRAARPTGTVNGSSTATSRPARVGRCQRRKLVDHLVGPGPLPPGARRRRGRAGPAPPPAAGPARPRRPGPGRRPARRPRAPGCRRPARHLAAAGRPPPPAASAARTARSAPPWTGTPGPSRPRPASGRSSDSSAQPPPVVRVGARHAGRGQPGQLLGRGPAAHVDLLGVGRPPRAARPPAPAG